jgi:hypothetical protein
MDHPIHLALALSGLFASAASLHSAEETTAAATAPTRQRLVSPHVAQRLAEVAARHPTPVAEAPVTEATAESAARQRVAAEARDVPANGIVRLPDYIVRDRKLPSPQEVMTRKALEQYAMQKYLGDERGFDRGFLNLFNVASLWKKIPLIGKVPIPGMLGFVTNEDRALQMYYDDRNRQRWSDALEFLSPAERDRVLRHPDRPAPLK